MKRLALVLAGIVALGADWPQKGDTVYVSAEMRVHYPAMPFTSDEDIALPACSPVRVVSVKPDGRVNGIDDSGAKWFLGASLAPALHRDRESCRDAIEANPDRRAVKTKWRMELAEPGH